MKDRVGGWRSKPFIIPNLHYFKFKYSILSWVHWLLVEFLYKLKLNSSTSKHHLPAQLRTNLKKQILSLFYPNFICKRISTALFLNLGKLSIPCIAVNRHSFRIFRSKLNPDWPNWRHSSVRDTKGMTETLPNFFSLHFSLQLK